jgi:5-methylcytosine-specific restriction endonuclease McrA
MFEYCTTGLGYSASAANRRIRTARCVAHFPEVLELLRTNEVNLSTVSQVAGILNPDNVAHILARIRGRTMREVEAVVAEQAPVDAKPRERVRTVVVRVPLGAASVAPQEPLLTSAPGSGRTTAEAPGSEARHHTNEYDRNGRGKEAPSAGTLTFERRALLQFSVHEAVMSKLDRVRSIASHRLPPRAPLEQLIEFLADYFTAREDPAARQVRRVVRSMKTKPEAATRSQTGTPHGERRTISASIRDQVFTRDSGRCTYVGPNGQHCGSTHVLQIDHINPVARGGPNAISNLRLLCAQHNRLEAERLMGRKYSRGT